MSNCVVELYGIDFIASYQHAFVYVRQVAIHLRDAYMARKNRRAVASVYTWQVYHCLKVWVKLLCANPNQPDIWHLAFPLCQIIHGIIGLVPSPRYYPLRIHYLHLLNDLAQSRSQAAAKPLFLNSLSYILEMLSYSFFHKNIKPWSGKPEVFQFSLTASDKIIQTYAFYDAIMREALELLVTYFMTYYKSVSFPELALPAIVQLKQFLQTCQPSPFPAKIKQFVEALENQSKVILSHRNLANFNPADEHKVAAFMSKLKQKTPLEVFSHKILQELQEQKKLILLQSEEDQKKAEEEEEEIKELAASNPETAEDLEMEIEDDQVKELNLKEFTEE
jgi:nucleolar complex protein 2